MSQHTLKHPTGDFEVTVDSDARRDTLVSRGYRLVGSAEKPATPRNAAPRAAKAPTAKKAGA